MQQQAIIERKPLWYGYWIILSSLMIVGLGVLGYRYTAGLLVTNLGSVISWGLWISLYILFIGLSAGSFLLSTLIYVFNVKQFERIGRLALYSAALCLIMGLLFVFADLGHPERFWQVFTNLAANSVLWFEIMFYLIYIVIILAELYLLSRTDLIALREKNTGIRHDIYRFLSLGSQRLDEASKKRDMKLVRILGIIGIPTAIAVHGGTGAVFAVVKAVPYWHSPLVPIAFIISAIASGGGLLLFIRAFFFKPAPDEQQFLSGLAKLVVFLIALDWLPILFEFLIDLYGGIPGSVAAVMAVIAGPNWWVFWLFQVALGLLIPIALVLYPRTKRSRFWLGAAGAFIVLGITGFRLNLVIGALYAARIERLSSNFFSPRLLPLYSPSAVEWVSSIGLLALFMILFSLGMKILPIQDEKELAPEPKRRTLRYGKWNT
jgi:Ni/Fe-hydrogenase subunit HybB-like protein